jgi:hypothetical protein
MELPARHIEPGCAVGASFQEILTDMKPSTVGSNADCEHDSRE